MARRTKREIMSGVDCTECKIIDHNTVEYMRENGDRVIRLHLTDIVTFKPNGTIILNTGGWNTVTTRDRINKQIQTFGWMMYSEKNEPYLSKGWWHDENRKLYHFHDGITISARKVKCDGKIYDKEREKKARAWQRKCRQYAKTFVAKLQRREIPAPGPGDCWMCSFVDGKDRAWGENSHQDHVIHHVIEKYYVPSLVMRATKQFGVSQCAQWCLAASWDKDNPKADEYLEHSTKPHGFGGIGWEQIERAIGKYVIRWAPFDEAKIKAIEKEVAA